MPRSIAGLLTAFLLFILCGCEPIQLPWAPLPEKNTPASTAALPEAGAMLEKALNTRAYFSTMEAKATMGIADKKNDFNLNTNVHIFAGARPDRLRIRATKAGIEAFDAVCQEGSVAFYVKRRRTLYHGSLEELEAEQKVPIRPNEILENLLQPDMHLKARSWKHVAVNRPFGRYPATIVLDENRPGSRWRVYLEGRSRLPVGVEKLDDAGTVLFRKTYDRYREFLPTVKGKAPEWYPFHITLAWPAREREVRIRFRNIKPGIELDDELFELEVPDNTRIKPISQTRVEGDKPPAPADTTP